MATVLLTDFVDIAHASGIPKATKVATTKNRPAYDPRFDFYKPLRETVIASHREGLGRAHLRELVPQLKDPKKIRIFPEAIAGYEKWWGRRAMPWVEPPSGHYSRHGVDVVVNPELGLEIDGRLHIVKLYFKSDPLSGSRTTIVTRLMELALEGRVPEATAFAVMDVRRSRLQVGRVNAKTDACLEAELAYINTLWDRV